MQLKKVVAAGVLLMAVSCNKNGLQETESGLKYRIIRDQEGIAIKQNDLVQLNLAYYSEGDSLLYDSRVIGDSFILKVNKPSWKGGLEEGLVLLSEGDSAEFILSADSVFRRLFSQPMPTSIRKGSDLKFRVGVRKILSQEDLRRKIQADLVIQQTEQIARIETYLSNNSIQAKPAEPGIYFVMLKDGRGKQAVYGDSVEVVYTGKTLDGRVFDSSAKAGQPLKFTIGKGNYLEAFERAVTSLKEGSLARLVLSSDHAFGKSTKGPVPPDTPVVFDIELIRIIK